MPADSLPLFRWTLRLLVPYTNGLLALVALAGAEVFLRAASPLALKAAVDTAGDAWLLTIAALGLAAYLALRAVMFLHSRVSAAVSWRVTRDMREMLLGHLERLALAEHEERPVGNAVYRLTAEAGWLEQLVLQAVMPAVFASLTLVVMFGVLASVPLTLVVSGTISAGTVLLLLLYLGLAYGPLTALSQARSLIGEAITSARRMREVVALKPEPSDVPGAPHLPPLKGAVRFDNVSFAYDIGRDVVRSVSFEVAPGELVAIVGPAGSGKRTVTGLLTRVNEPTRGRILVDWFDTKTCAIKSLRAQVGVVPQEAILVSGTVRDNLRYGRLSATDDAIENAARAANADCFIREFPEGYDTPLGTRGGRLSRGQRHRLSIARAFLKDAPILIVDEPPSALDTVSETRFVDVLDRLRRDRTTFVIAHRVTTLQGADRILVMDGGVLVASGTHDGLLAGCPLYAKLATDLTDSRPYRIAV